MAGSARVREPTQLCVDARANPCRTEGERGLAGQQGRTEPARQRDDAHDDNDNDGGDHPRSASTRVRCGSSHLASCARERNDFGNEVVQNTSEA